MGDSPLSPPPDADAASLRAHLIDEFRSALDESLIIAILDDYDLTLHLHDVRAILQGLSQDVESEEASRSHASGTYGESDHPSGHHEPSNTHSSLSVTGSKPHTDMSPRTDFSDALSEHLETLDLCGDLDTLALDEDGKIAELTIMFPLLKELDIAFYLKKAGGDIAKACEELLSTQFLEENGLRAKGIEGAFREDGCIFSKKPKKRNSVRSSGDHDGASPVNGPPCPSGAEIPKEKAGRARLDIDYRLKPTDLELDLRAAKSPAPSLLSARGPVTRRKSLPRLLPSTSASSPAICTPRSAVAETTPTDWQAVTSYRQRKSYSELADDAATEQASTARSFATAAAAFRRGRSDPLYRPVAGILAERAREQLGRSRAALTASYEALVDENSSAGHIDLHGVPVAEGARMALERTEAWWAGLGEERVRRARADGFVIVTGLGRHSASGVSRLRQEVGAALKQAGWRTRTETGQFVVTGRA